MKIYHLAVFDGSWMLPPSSLEHLLVWEVDEWVIADFDFADRSRRLCAIAANLEAFDALLQSRAPLTENCPKLLKRS